MPQQTAAGVIGRTGGAYRRKSEPQGTSGSAGAEAGKDTKYAELSEQQLWDQYKVENKLGALVSKKVHEKPFAAWRVAQEAKRKGQEKAAATIAKADE